MLDHVRIAAYGYDLFPDIGQDLSLDDATVPGFFGVHAMPERDPGIFVEGIEGKTVYGRWLGYTGVKPASPDEATTAGPLFKVLRLID